MTNDTHNHHAPAVAHGTLITINGERLPSHRKARTMKTELPAPRTTPRYTPKLLSPSDWLESAASVGHVVPTFPSLRAVRDAIDAADPVALVAAIRYTAHGGPSSKPWKSTTVHAMVRRGLANPACPAQVRTFADTFWKN